MRYFPFYTLLVETELDDLRANGFALPDVELLNACFFGYGPGPEVIGLINYLRKLKSETLMISSRLMDIASEAWSHSRKIIPGFLAEPLWELRLIEHKTNSVSLQNADTLRGIDLKDCLYGGN